MGLSLLWAAGACAHCHSWGGEVALITASEVEANSCSHSCVIVGTHHHSWGMVGCSLPWMGWYCGCLALFVSLCCGISHAVAGGDHLWAVVGFIVVGSHGQLVGGCGCSHEWSLAFVCGWFLIVAIGSHCGQSSPCVGTGHGPRLSFGVCSLFHGCCGICCHLYLWVVVVCCCRWSLWAVITIVMGGGS